MRFFSNRGAYSSISSPAGYLNRGGDGKHIGGGRPSLSVLECLQWRLPSPLPGACIYNVLI
jgi:hypothetical protein